MGVISMFLVELVGLYREAISRCFSMFCRTLKGFPGSSADTQSACNAGDPGSIPGLGRSFEGGNGNPVQYFYLENPMDRGNWQTMVHGVAQSQT